MSEGRLAIIGASGLVGAALCERLYFEGRRDFTPFIHSPGNAARIARLRLPLQTLDLMDRAQVRQALSGFQTVVNCSRGDDTSMIKGLRNLTGAMKRNRAGKFIHISSVAIYGNDPAPGSASESFAPDPGDNEYGRLKARQDEMVFALERAGVRSYIFCPPNISGPYSPFVLGLAKRMRSGPVVLVDEGRHPCNLSHVDNLVQAILTAEASDSGSGERYFVNEAPAVTWRQYLHDLMCALNLRREFVLVSREEALRSLAPAPEPRGPAANLKIALSGEFRQAVSMLPAMRSLNAGALAVFNSLPERVRGSLRQNLQSPIHIEKEVTGPSLQDHYIRVQARTVYHSPDKLVRKLNYRPALTYDRGVETTAAWLRFAGVGNTYV
jgi:nucleoside-diphosphate-sugar epimerase